MGTDELLTSAPEKARGPSLQPNQMIFHLLYKLKYMLPDIRPIYKKQMIVKLVFLEIQ